MFGVPWNGASCYRAPIRPGTRRFRLEEAGAIHRDDNRGRSTLMSKDRLRQGNGVGMHGRWKTWQQRKPRPLGILAPGDRDERMPSSDIGHASAGADSRSRPATGTAWLQTETKRTGYGRTRLPASEQGQSEVADGDISNDLGQIPHGELMKSAGRRVGDGRMPRLIKACLLLLVEEDDGNGGKRPTIRAPKEQSVKAPCRGRRVHRP